MMDRHRKLKMLSPTVNHSSLILAPDTSKGYLSDVLSNLSSLRDYYPEFDRWVETKVVPGLSAGERSLLLEYRQGEVAGFAILKNDGVEKKLCCLRVMEGFQNSAGLGIRLFERAFEELNTERPLLSVAEERLPVFQRIFNHFGFELSQEYRSKYRIGKVEYAFNGFLDSASESHHLALTRYSPQSLNDLRSRHAAR